MIKIYLSRLYDAAGALAALFLVGIGLFVLYSIGGGIFGYVARSADEFAGYCMAASSFLALAHTFGRGEHIRVLVILQRLQGRTRRRAEVLCLLMALYLSGYFAFYATKMTYQSWVFKELSQGLVPTPVWIPQLGMALGAFIFAVAVLERLVDVMMGGALDEPSSEARSE